jgi:hypothetical protein
MQHDGCKVVLRELCGEHHDVGLSGVRYRNHQQARCWGLALNFIALG